MKAHAIVAVTLLVASTSGVALVGCAQEPSIRVLSSNGVRAVVEERTRDIERAIGRSVSFDFSTASSLASQIENGEPFDVAILTPALIERLIAVNRVTSDSRVDFARTGVGVGMRAGSDPGDVGTSATFRDTMLAADSVAFTADGQSRVTIDAAFATLGITELMQSRIRLLGPGEAPRAVAAGDAELALTLISEILPVPGLELLGPLPAELQGYVSFAAGRGTATTDVQPADALIEYLAGGEFAVALASYGMEPIGR